MTHHAERYGSRDRTNSNNDYMETCTAYFSDTGMRLHGIYPTPITNAATWIGHRHTEGPGLDLVMAVIAESKERSRRHGGAIGITGYPTGSSQAGHIDAVDDTPLYTNGAMIVCAIVHNDRVIYGSLFTDLPPSQKSLLLAAV